MRSKNKQVETNKNSTAGKKLWINGLLILGDRKVDQSS